MIVNYTLGPIFGLHATCHVDKQHSIKKSCHPSHALTPHFLMSGTDGDSDISPTGSHFASKGVYQQLS